MTGTGNRPAVPSGDDGALVEEAATWFVRMRSDGVTDQDRRDFGAWLDHDPAHRLAYEDAAQLWGEIGMIPDPRPAGGRNGSAVTPQDASAPSTGRPTVARLCGAVAACLALISALGLWAPNIQDIWRADHATAVGETRRFTLDDGSSIEMNTDTSLAVRYTAERRMIELFRGEAFFSVAKDPDRPFLVKAGKGVARAVGTAFNIRDAGGNVTVLVDEGRVRVSRRADHGAGDDADGVTLSPGEAARYGPTGAINLTQDEPSVATAWRQGRLVFANMALGDVVAELDRYRPGAIVLASSRIAQERFTGVFSLRDTDQAMAAIQATLPVEAVRMTPFLTVLWAAD